MNASSAGPRAPLQAVALMAHRAVETLRWLQPLAKVTRVRSLMCDIALLSPNDITQTPPQQQQQGAEVAGAEATAAEGQGPPSSSSSQLAAVERQLWQVVRDLVGRLAAPNPRPCRIQVGARELRALVAAYLPTFAKCCGMTADDGPHSLLCSRLTTYY